MSPDLILGIALWSMVLAVFFPKEWALKLYAGPFGRMWDKLVRAIEWGWRGLVLTIVRRRK